MDVFCVHVSFICRSYFLGNSPLFFSGSETKNFYNGAELCFTNSQRDPAMEIVEKFGICHTGACC